MQHCFDEALYQATSAFALVISIPDLTCSCAQITIVGEKSITTSNQDPTRQSLTAARTGYARIVAQVEFNLSGMSNSDYCRIICPFSCSNKEGRSELKAIGMWAGNPIDLTVFSPIPGSPEQA
jgi:hypothetical protein